MFNEHREGAGMHDKILRLRAVKERTGLSRSAIYAGISRGTFPQQISLGTRTVGWTELSIDRWIRHRICLAEAKNAANAAQVE
jgi:prophage regulatory protein